MLCGSARAAQSSLEGPPALMKSYVIIFLLVIVATGCKSTENSAPGKSELRDGVDSNSGHR